MPHQCVRCNTIYEDTANELLKGCSCGAKLFFYVKKKEDLKPVEATKKLSKEEVVQIENDVREMIGEHDREKPVVLDLENIQIDGQGKYMLDLVRIFKGEPLVYRVDDGKYMIDLASSFQIFKKKKKKE